MPTWSRAISERWRGLSPRQILLVGWLGLLLYGYPGFMSFDSMWQLAQTHAGHYNDWHPPVMAGLWRLCEVFIAGPAGMLLLQSACFLAGSYLVFRSVMSERAAAIIASLVLWFPPIATVMAVIWKDSQMIGFLMLGVGLIIQERRGVKLWGLVALLLGTAMRHNAAAITVPLVVLCFVWDPAHRFIKRYGLALAVSLAITIVAQLGNAALTDEEQHLWHTNIALNDITATLRYTEQTIPDDELRATFAGIRLLPDRDLHEAARRGHAENDGEYISVLWTATNQLFFEPQTREERDAVMRAWKQIVFGHPGAYLAYRWHLSKMLLEINGEPLVSPVYCWFIDIQDPDLSPLIGEHDASGGKIQNVLRDALQGLGRPPGFWVALYLVAGIVLLAVSVRDRVRFALLASGLANEAALFVVAPTPDERYSIWLVVVVVVTAILLVGKRHAGRRATASATIAMHVALTSQCE